LITRPWSLDAASRRAIDRSGLSGVEAKPADDLVEQMHASPSQTGAIAEQKAAARSP